MSEGRREQGDHVPIPDGRNDVVLIAGHHSGGEGSACICRKVNVGVLTGQTSHGLSRCLRDG